jgi:hypothetical protein
VLEPVTHAFRSGGGVVRVNGGMAGIHCWMSKFSNQLLVNRSRPSHMF